MMKPAAWSVRPNQIIAKGIQAKGGMGLTISTMGSMILSAALNHPISMPIGRAIKSPPSIPKPK